MVGEQPGRLLAELAHLGNLQGKINILRCIFSVSFLGSEPISSHPTGRSVRFRDRLEKLKPRSWVKRRLEVRGAEGHTPHTLLPLKLLCNYLLCSSSTIRWHHLQSKSRIRHAQNFELAQTGGTGIKIFHGISACDEFYAPEPRTVFSAGSISPQLARTLMRRLT